VSALSTLKDDDISDGSGLYSSDEENVNKTHGHLKTLGSDGPHVPHKGYGDYRPPLKKGGGGTFPPFGGQYPHPTRRYGTTKKDHANSKYGTPKIGSPNLGTLKSGTPKNKSFSQRSKRVKDVLKALWKKCVCQGKKHPRWMMFFAVVILSVLYVLVFCCAKSGAGTRNCALQACKEAATAATSTCQHVTSITAGVTIFTATAAIFFAILGLLIGCYYFKSLEKYIQSKHQH
ncbi:hypothetical protein, conserved in P.knowlesi, partial [Plasmodium knowlesi strain H]